MENKTPVQYKEMLAVGIVEDGNLVALTFQQGKNFVKQVCATKDHWMEVIDTILTLELNTVRLEFDGPVKVKLLDVTVKPEASPDSPEGVHIQPSDEGGFMLLSQHNNCYIKVGSYTLDIVE